MMGSGKEESLNSHWAALSRLGLRLKINKCLSSPASPVVRLLRVRSGLRCHRYE